MAMTGFTTSKATPWVFGDMTEFFILLLRWPVCEKTTIAGGHQVSGARPSCKHLEYSKLAITGLTTSLAGEAVWRYD